MKVLGLSLVLFGLHLLFAFEGAQKADHDYVKVVMPNSKKMVGLLASLDNKLDEIIKEMRSSSCRNLRMDFENGIRDWTKKGTAFNNQPTYGDNPSHRNSQPAQQQGHWWIGGYENRPGPSHPAGQTQGDSPTGILTSPVFRITGKTLSFLIGGGCDVAKVRVELLIAGGVVKKETGRCNETMERRYWDVRSYQGKAAQVRLVDQSSGGWGHINFDDLSCV